MNKKRLALYVLAVAALAVVLFLWHRSHQDRLFDEAVTLMARGGMWNLVQAQDLHEHVAEPRPPYSELLIPDLIENAVERLESLRGVERFNQHTELLLGMALLRLDRYDQAVQALEAFESAYPGNFFDVGLLLTEHYARSGQIEKARSKLAPLIKLYHDDWPYELDYLAWLVEFEDKNYERSLEIAQDLIGHARDGGAYLEQAASLYMLDRQEEAETSWIEAVRMNPELAEVVQEERKRLSKLKAEK